MSKKQILSWFGWGNAQSMRNKLKGYRPCRRPRQIGGGGQRVIHACLSLLICLAKRWCNATTNKRWWGNHQDQGPKNARIQASSGSQFLVKGLCGACIRNRETPAGFKPKPAKTIPVKVPNVAFWRPKETERWCNATTNKRWCNHQDQGPKNARIQASSGRQFLVKGLCGACMRNRETPAGFKPKPAKTIPRKTL